MAATCGRKAKAEKLLSQDEVDKAFKAAMKRRGLKPRSTRAGITFSPRASRLQSGELMAGDEPWSL